MAGSPAPTSETRTLLVIAAPKEAEAVLRGLGASGESTINWTPRALSARFDLVVTGVGKANAAGATARALDLSRHRAVINMGVSGALPASGLRIGDVVDAERSVYGDEGSSNPPPGRFTTIAEMGFGPLADLCGPGNGMDGMAVPAAPILWPRRAEFPALPIRCGGVATVSTCSGNDALALEIERRTGALAEDMESAAVGFTVARLAPGIAFSALRVISNTTGNRLAQTWNLTAALSRLREIAGLL
jgi:futalosine hydrolase